jgi:hypothetical protein
MSCASGAMVQRINLSLNYKIFFFLLQNKYFICSSLKSPSTSMAYSSLSKETIALPQTNLKVLSS